MQYSNQYGRFAMNRLFECLDSGFFKTPDGTRVNPFLNPKDMMSGLPGDVLDGSGIAAGYIDPGIVSEIHVHPFIFQATVLLSGALDIHMKDYGNGNPPYTLELGLPTPAKNHGFTTAAALTPPGTFFQIDNSRGSEPARVLYVTSPGYIFEPGEASEAPPIYDDAVVLGRDWGYLEKQNWNPLELGDPAHSYEARQRAMERLSAKR